MPLLHEFMLSIFRHRLSSHFDVWWYMMMDILSVIYMHTYINCLSMSMDIYVVEIGLAHMTNECLCVWLYMLNLVISRIDRELSYLPTRMLGS